MFVKKALVALIALSSIVSQAAQTSYTLKELCSHQAENIIKEHVFYDYGELDVFLIDEVTAGEETIQEYSVTSKSVGGYDCDESDCHKTYQITFSIQNNICIISEPTFIEIH